MLNSVPKKRLVIIGATGIMALGIAAPAAAFAAEGSQTPSASQPDRESRHAQRHQKLADALAKELGVDVDKVSAALEKVHSDLKAEADQNRPERSEADKADRAAALKERLATAVTEGKLTQAEADAILKAAEAGVLPFGGGHGGGMRR